VGRSPHNVLPIVNALDDFCLWAPPSNKSSFGDSRIGNTEQIEVAWCLRSGYGTRLIPPGAIKGAHFTHTPLYVQVTGVGDLTSLNIPKGDPGGELDPHGYDGNGNPIGGLVFGTAFNGTLRQYHEWTNFMGANFFCFRVCLDGPEAPKYCQHIYDTLGCGWNMPGNYSEGFDDCQADPTEPMGIYVTNGVTTTFHQGDPVTPPAHTPGKSSSCTYYATLSNVNSPAGSPTASLLPSSVSASLSRASVASVKSLSSHSVESTSSVGTITTLTTSRTGSGPIPSSTTHNAGTSTRVESALPRLLVGAIGGLVIGIWAVAHM